MGYFFNPLSGRTAILRLCTITDPVTLHKRFNTSRSSIFLLEMVDHHKVSQIENIRFDFIQKLITLLTLAFQLFLCLRTSLRHLYFFKKNWKIWQLLKKSFREYFWGCILVIGKIWNLLWQIYFAFEQIFIGVSDQILRESSCHLVTLPHRQIHWATATRHPGSSSLNDRSKFDNIQTIFAAVTRQKCIYY